MVEATVGDRGRRRARARKDARQTFVLIDDDPLWHSFHQTAAVLRRNGCRTVRATTAPSGPVSKLLDRFVYDDRIELADPSDLSPLVERLADCNVAAVFAVESVLAEASEDAFDELSAEVADNWRRRKKYCDKAEAAKLAVELGIRVPEQLSAATHPVAAAVAELGLPLVVKKKVAAAGAGVRIAATTAEVETAIAELGPPEEVFFERYVTGPVVCYGTMIGDSGAIQEAVDQGFASAADPTQAPLSRTAVECDELAEFGRKLSAATGLRGPMNVQGVLDSEGRYWVIDLNVRPYGPVFSWDQDLLDTKTAFLAAMNLSDKQPIHRYPPVGTPVNKFPNDVEQLARNGSYGRALRTFASRAREFSGHLGPKYLAYVLLSGVASKLRV